MWRPALAADDDAVVDMCLALYNEDPSSVVVSAEQVRRTLVELRRTSTRGRAVVLDLGQEPAGYAFLIAFWSNELGGEICVLDEIYVVSQARGRGYARDLITSLEDGSTGTPPPVALELEVSPDNRARRLYERLGFTPIRNTTMRRRLVSR